MTTKKPAHSIRSRSVQAAIWRNDGKNGPYYRVTFSRRYRDGDTWKSTESFNADDLTELMLVTALALQWIRTANRTKEEAAE